MLWLVTHFGAACSGGNFLSFPPWYKYLNGNIDPITNACTPELGSINDVWLIVAAIIEILLRVSALAAIGFIIYGGFEYLTSQAEPEKTNRAKQTIIYAVIGLVISIMAATIINFVAGSIS